MRVEENESNRPFAYADPRSLSQAWYDALHRAPRHVQANPQARSPHADRQGESPTLQSPHMAAREGASHETSSLPYDRRSDERRAQAGGARDAADAPLARKRGRETAPASQRHLETARTDVEVHDGETSLKLLFAQRGANVEVVAVCDRAARERAADALARARIALAGKGIALEPTIRERGER